MILFSVPNLGAFLKNNSGNILFLILIAVALFATLGYAVIQSTRGGDANAIKETSTINAAVLSQYTASLRAAIQRMTTGGIDVIDLEFNPPEDFASLTSTSVGVFHTSGGAVIYQNAPISLIDAQGDNPTGKWVFTMNFEVKGVGTNSANSLDGNDLVAFMVGVRKDVCEQINSRLGIPTKPLPSMDSQSFSDEMFSQFQDTYADNDYTMPTSEYILGDVNYAPELSGRAEGCYWEDEGKNYVYYGVISER